MNNCKHCGGELVIKTLDPKNPERLVSVNDEGLVDMEVCDDCGEVTRETTD